MIQKNSQTYLKNLAVFTWQTFKSMLDHFSALRKKWLNCNFQSILKKLSQLFYVKP